MAGVDESEISLRGLLAAMRWMLPMGLVVGVGIGLWELWRGGEWTDLLAGVLVGVVLVVALGPLMWLRWTPTTRSWAGAKRVFAALALALAWAVGWIALAVVVG